MTRRTELELRRTPREGKIPLAVRAFDALGASEAVVVADDQAPRELLRELQRSRPHCFDWSVLEWGPHQFRVELVRHEPSPDEGTCDVLQRDHRRLDALFVEVERYVSLRAFEEALPEFAAFSTGLRRHIALEEAILFPVFDEQGGFGGGPTMVMRAEHRSILDSLDSCDAALDEGDVKAFEDAASGLLDVLGQHNLKEEQILYPGTDAGLDSEARRTLIGRMREF